MWKYEEISKFTWISVLGKQAQKSADKFHNSNITSKYVNQPSNAPNNKNNYTIPYQ